MNAPTALEISAARAAAGLTQTEAAELLYVSLRAWQLWEADSRTMAPALFELFLLKTNQAQLRAAR
jgi:DNA-binding transcriptional regulator YiaG